MRNIEIKAKTEDLEAIISRIEREKTKLGSSNVTVIKQHDIFFNVPEGRLKLRQFETGSGELIYYKRPNTTGPKLCDYEKIILDSEACKGIEKILSETNGRLGDVIKTRRLIMIGQTRVHLDEVKELGTFIELEVGLNNDQDEATGEKIAKDLMSMLGIDNKNLIATAYIDLLKESKESQ